MEAARTQRRGSGRSRGGRRGASGDPGPARCSRSQTIEEVESTRRRHVARLPAHGRRTDHDVIESRVCSHCPLACSTEGLPRGPRRSSVVGCMATVASDSERHSHNEPRGTKSDGTHNSSNKRPRRNEKQNKMSHTRRAQGEKASTKKRFSSDSADFAARVSPAQSAGTPRGSPPPMR